MGRNLHYDESAHKWRCRRMVNGRVYKASFTRKEDASEWLRQLERAASGLDPLPALVTLSEAWELYQSGLKQRGTTGETLRYYEAKHAALAAELGEHRVVNRIAQADVSAYIDARREQNIGNRTLRAELALLHRMTRRAGIEPRWKVPALKIEEHPRAVPTPAQLASVWRQLEGPSLVALALCTLTGIRASEAFRAKAEDVDRKGGVLRLSGRKSGDTHTVAVVPTLAELLPRRGPLVKMTPHEVGCQLKRASKAAGVPRLTGPGIGRHAFATWAVAHCGFTTEQVSDALGHAKPGATRRYIHAAAVEPVRRPMAKAIEGLLLAELARLQGAPVLRFTRGKG
jgi:integrase